MSPVFTETFNGALVELVEIVRTIATYQAAIAAVEIEIVAMWIEGSIFLVSTAVQTPGVCVIAVEPAAQNINRLFSGEQVVQLDHRTAASIAQIPVLVTVVQLFNGCGEDRLVIGVMALSCAVKFLKDTLSTIVSILGVLFILYFFAPGLYADLIVMLMQALRWLGSLFAGLSSH